MIEVVYVKEIFTFTDVGRKIPNILRLLFVEMGVADDYLFMPNHVVDFLEFFVNYLHLTVNTVTFVALFAIYPGVSDRP